MGRPAIAAVIVALGVLMGCADDRSDGWVNAYPAGAFLIVIEPNRFTDTQKEVILLSAEVVSEFFTREFPRPPAPTEVHVTWGRHVQCTGAPAGVVVDGCYDFRAGGIIRAPASDDPGVGFTLKVLYHELWHRHAPSSIWFDYNHTYFDWGRIQATEPLIQAEIARRMADRGLVP